MVDISGPSYINETRNRPSGQTLLEKYEIPVSHLDYSYIQTCKDKRKLGQIVQILRSGEEGHYPDLTKFAEERLNIIDPKNKLLRTTCPVRNMKTIDREEMCEIDADLKNWLKNVNHNDKELDSRKVKNPYKDDSFPRIREKEQQSSDTIATNKSKRISSTDYESWSKFDPDTELLKMEIEEEKEKKAALEQEKLKENSKNQKKKSVTFNTFATEAEAVFEADREKEKGNECFKSGEYVEAIDHYSLSIKYKPSLAGYNNRAIAWIKLKSFREALDDCNCALAIEADNFKALMRKTLALEGLERYAEASMTLERLIRMDPNDAKVQEMAAKLRKQTGCELKNKRMAIQDG